jgi:DNA polymerase-4
MPMAEAQRRCPDAVVVPPRMAHYAEVSAAVFRIFRRFTPLVEGLSLDEAFLDVTASRSLFGDGAAIARKIQAAVAGELALGCSAGVAPCKFAAKIASDLRKPRGLVVVPDDDVAGFLAPLPIERMWGVGPKTAPVLHAAGLRTIGDLASASPAKLRSMLGTWGEQVRELARGHDDRPVDPDGEARSVGAEETFEEDLALREDLDAGLLAQASRVAARLLAEDLAARVVVVKVKFADFQVVTRRTTLSEPVTDTGALHAAAKDLLDRVPLAGRRVRLLGVSASGLEPIGARPTLFAAKERERALEVERVLAAAREKFGGAGLTFGTLARPKK